MSVRCTSCRSGKPKNPPVVPVPAGAAERTARSGAAARSPPPKLKGSIGEGSNHSNFSEKSSVRILGIQRKFFQNSGIFARKFKKFGENFNMIFRISVKFSEYQ